MQSTWWRTPAARHVRDAMLLVVTFGIGLAGHVAAVSNADVEAAPLSTATALGAAIAAGLLWWRRRHLVLVPLAVIVTAITVASIEEPGLFSAQVAVEVMVLCFTAGSWSRRPRVTSATLGVALVAIVAGSLGDGTSVAAAGAVGFALVAFPAAAGYASRVRRLYVEQVEARLVEAERDRDERARRAIADERTRIARELHDVVAHHVSLIGVQAGAARLALGRSPEATSRALEAIEASSREAIGEMRLVLEALRPLGEKQDEQRAPQPGIATLPALVEQWRAAGYEISLRLPGVDVSLPPALSLCCYRVVEEALTNVARHSCATTAEICASVHPVGMTITVADPGPHRSAAAVTGDRRGHVGMVERVAIFGGTVQVGPTPGGGYLVTVHLPRVLS